MREVLAVVIFISVLAMFLVTRYSNTPAKQVEEPIATCGVESNDDKRNSPAIFKVKCATCHMYEKNATGPALRGIEGRQPYKTWFGEFVTNQDSLIHIREPFTDSIMDWSMVEFIHDFKELNRQDLDELLQYFNK